MVDRTRTSANFVAKDSRFKPSQSEGQSQIEIVADETTINNENGIKTLPPISMKHSNNITIDENDHNHNDEDEDENDISYTPCQSMEWATLPKPTLPPQSEMKPVEQFVFDAISSRTTSATNNTVMDPTAQAASANHYKAILELLRKRDDATLLRKVLLAIRSGGEGMVMGKMTGMNNSKRHSQLLHLIFSLDPFDLKDNNNTNKDDVGLLLNKKRGRDEDNDIDADAHDMVEINFDLVEAHLNLVVALVSSNSVFLTPALNAIWKLIAATDSITKDDRQLTLYHYHSISIGNDNDDDNDNDNDTTTTSTSTKVVEESHSYADIVVNKNLTTETTTIDNSNSSNNNNNKKLLFMIQQQYQRNAKLHGTLSKILQLVPRGNSELFPVLASGFPFKLRSLEQQACYMKQCFTVLNYVPTIRKSVLELCIDKCLEIDVEIRIAQDGKVNIDNMEQQQQQQQNDANNNEGKDHGGEDGIFDLDMNLGMNVNMNLGMNVNVNMNMNKNNNESGDNKNNKIKGQDKDKEQKDSKEELRKKTDLQQVGEMAEKLDTLMYLTFQYLVATSSSNVKTPRQLYKMILSTFDSVIITTHRSKFVQFVILFLCGLDGEQHANSSTNSSANNHDQQQQLQQKQHQQQQKDHDDEEQSMLSREFAAKLIDLVLDPFRAIITRQSAACYLASFVSRSRFVCASTACEAVSAILRFADAYMEAYPTEASARNARKNMAGDAGNADQNSKVVIHSLFYTVAQAAFYIMCFRGKECIEHYEKAVVYHSSIDHSQENDDDDDDHILLYSDPELIDISLNRWTTLCSHHLTPLKFCLESVRGEFLLLSDRFDLIESTLLGRLIIQDRKMASGLSTGKKKIKRASSIRTAATLERRRISGGVGGLGRGSNPLDSFFPFDPYLLRRSYTFVDPYYRHWEGSANVSRDEDREEEEDHVENSVQEDSSMSGEDDHDDESDDDEHDKFQNDHSLIEVTECAAMSLTSTTCSLNESDWKEDEADDEVTAEDMAIPKDNWVKELRRARALSVEDCW